MTSSGLESATFQLVPSTLLRALGNVIMLHTGLFFGLFISLWRYRRYISPKHRFAFNWLHSVKTYKIGCRIMAVVRTANRNFVMMCPADIRHSSVTKRLKLCLIHGPARSASKKERCRSSQVVPISATDWGEPSSRCWEVTGQQRAYLATWSLYIARWLLSLCCLTLDTSMHWQGVCLSV
jgi:hypothetical protein